MKVLGLVYSPRENGNCVSCISYCLDSLSKLNHETELIKLYDYDINPCSCDYECFPDKNCMLEDDIKDIYDKCIGADLIISAIPTYRGHLSSAYFTFSERGQGIFRNGLDHERDYLKKVNMIIIGNLSSGGDMALHEALYDFSNRSFYPETILLSSREFGRRSILGDLIEDEDVKKKLDRFVEAVLKRK